MSEREREREVHGHKHAHFLFSKEREFFFNYLLATDWTFIAFLIIASYHLVVQ